MFCQRCWTVSTVVVILTVSLLIISCAGKSSPTEPEVNELPASVVLAGPEDVESTSLVLRWSSSSESDFAEYRLFMSETAGVDTNSTLVATIVSATDTSTAIEDLVPETTYYFVIYVLDQAGQSTASNVVSATARGTFLPVRKQCGWE